VLRAEQDGNSHHENSCLAPEHPDQLVSPLDLGCAAQGVRNLDADAPGCSPSMNHMNLWAREYLLWCGLIPILRLKVFIEMLTIIFCHHLVNGIEHRHKPGYDSALIGVGLHIAVGTKISPLVQTSARHVRFAFGSYLLKILDLLL
jgi:hypothetical protein